MANRIMRPNHAPRTVAAGPLLVQHEAGKIDQQRPPLVGQLETPVAARRGRLGAGGADGTGGMVIWPLFGATNQILAGMTLLIISVLLLSVGTFMAMTPAVLVFPPILLPAAMALGVDPVHFGIIMIANLCIGLCTPPVGTVLFIGCGIAKLSIGEIVRPLLAFFAAMLVALVVVPTFLLLGLGVVLLFLGEFNANLLMGILVLALSGAAATGAAARAACVCAA